MKKRICRMLLIGFCAFLLSGCQGNETAENETAENEVAETENIPEENTEDTEDTEDIEETESENKPDESGESDDTDKSSKEDDENKDSEGSHEIIEIDGFQYSYKTGDEGFVKIYGLQDMNYSRPSIPVSAINLTASVSVEELLKGKPMFYARIQKDEWVFEWLESDYIDKERDYANEAVLVVSKKEHPNEVQVIYPTTEWSVGGNGGDYYFTDFLYEDVNFDNLPDVLVSIGPLGNQGLERYYCFLRQGDTFREEPTYTEIANPEVGAENKVIYGHWRNSASSFGYGKYCYQNGKYTETVVLTSDIYDDVVIYTINGKETEIKRDDSYMEKVEKLYIENGLNKQYMY